MIALEEINKKIDRDAARSKIQNNYLCLAIEKLKLFVRSTELPDDHIEDINAMIGMYFDQIEFDCGEEEYLICLEIFRDCYEDCILLSEQYGKFSIVKWNLEKLKKYSGDDAVFKS